MVIAPLKSAAWQAEQLVRQVASWVVSRSAGFCCMNEFISLKINIAVVFYSSGN
jgi:hypothetical protein